MKLKILSLVFISLLLFDCGPKFSDPKATDIIKQSFELTEEDSLEILGISMESKNVAIVKFNLNDTQISSKIRKYDSGWQLEEVKNDLGMWVAAENITKLFSQPKKQKNAMKDILAITTGIADYVTDYGVVPSQNGIYNRHDEFYNALSPFYIKVLPVKDPWGNNYRVYCGKACEEMYGISSPSKDDFIVTSLGRDGQMEFWKFYASNLDAGLFIIKNEADFNKDIVMWNGNWIRAPRSPNLYNPLH